jgi:hypothetical protein
MNATRAPGHPEGGSANATPKNVERSDWRRCDVPPSLRRLYGRVRAGEASPRQAIKMQCAECTGYDRAAVAECPARACPLWRYRPWQRGTTGRSPTGEAQRP